MEEGWEKQCVGGKGERHGLHGFLKRSRGRSMRRFRKFSQLHRRNLLEWKKNLNQHAGILERGKRPRRT